MQKQNFLEKNKVLIIGFLIAALSAIVPYVQLGDVPLPNILWAVFIAGLSWGARNLRGQWATILGTIITSITQAGATELKPGIQWVLLGLNAGIAVLSVFSSPPKSREYEHSPTIVEAKSEAKAIIEEKKEDAKNN